MNIKVLGTGCVKCKKLYAEAQKAVNESGQDIELSMVDQIPEIMKYGIMMTPALVLDEEIKIVGRVASAHKIGEWIRAAQS